MWGLVVSHIFQWRCNFDWSLSRWWQVEDNLYHVINPSWWEIALLKTFLKMDWPGCRCTVEFFYGLGKPAAQFSLPLSSFYPKWLSFVLTLSDSLQQACQLSGSNSEEMTGVSCRVTEPFSGRLTSYSFWQSLSECYTLVLIWLNFPAMFILPCEARRAEVAGCKDMGRRSASRGWDLRKRPETSNKNAKGSGG